MRAPPRSSSWTSPGRWRGSATRPARGAAPLWRARRGWMLRALSCPGRVSRAWKLAEKARERLLEAVRLAPENVAGHRRLKALYLERPQVEEACGEILAIAQILHMRGQREAAQRELQEGLRLAPGHAALERLLAEVSGTAGAAPAPAKIGRASCRE